MHSPSILSSKWLTKINKSDADIIHLHWVQGEMLSIREISEIKKNQLYGHFMICGLYVDVNIMLIIPDISRDIRLTTNFKMSLSFSI